jgi:hypothetical protein
LPTSLPQGFDHLSLQKTPEGVGLDVRHDAGVGVHGLVYAGVAEDLLRPGTAGRRDDEVVLESRPRASKKRESSSRVRAS